MPQVTISKPLTYYLENSFVKNFQSLAGESLENLNKSEAWDIIIVLCHAASFSNQFSMKTIDIDSTVTAIDYHLELSKNCSECLYTLDEFPTNQVNALMKGIISVVFEV